MTRTKIGLSANSAKVVGQPPLPKHPRENMAMRRRKFLGLAASSSALLCLPSQSFGSDDIKVASPSGNVQFSFSLDDSRLSYAVTLNGHPVIETSPMGIIVDDVDLGRGVELGGEVRRERVNETYPWRGVHSTAINRYRAAGISVTHTKSNTRYTVEVRVFDDGVAFRYVVPGGPQPRTPGASTAFVIPAGSTVWYHGFFAGFYEGMFQAKDISDVRTGEWSAPPLTIKLPNNLGYAAITEGGLLNYAGMGLEADGHRAFWERLGNDEPVSYPYLLRYGAKEAKRLKVPASIVGTITTPWRVVMAGSDLNALVNCDIITNVCPPPDAALFPQGIRTDWIKPGRAVWMYLDGGERTLDGEKEFSRMAGQLGFEHNVVEGFWTKWSDSELRDFVAYSNQQNVKIWLWKSRKDMDDPAARLKFLQYCHDAGVAGVKIDFFDNEAKAVDELYLAILKDAAENKLMVNFHGANKPTGEMRTWPNGLTREGIEGLEYSRGGQGWAIYNTTLPFTRFLAGPADYTPMLFGPRRHATSWPHQIATAAVFTSALLTYGAHPKSILENPAVNMIKSIPSTWDETIALPMCEIGAIAAFARRSGRDWFLAVLNGPVAREIEFDLSFLGDGKYQALLVRDKQDDPAAVDLENTVLSKKDTLRVVLRSSGGFIGRFSP